MIQPICATNFCTKKYVAKNQPTFKSNKIYVIADTVARQKEPISALGESLTSKLSALETGVTGKFSSIMEGLSEKTTDFLENAVPSFTSTTPVAEAVAQFQPRGAILNHYVGDGSFIIKIWAKDAKPVDKMTFIDNDANNFYTPLRSLKDLKGVELSAEDIAELRQIPEAVEVLGLAPLKNANVSFAANPDNIDMINDNIDSDILADNTNVSSIDNSDLIEDIDADGAEQLIETIDNIIDTVGDIV